jgi:subtilisin family serine protease
LTEEGLSSLEKLYNIEPIQNPQYKPRIILFHMKAIYLFLLSLLLGLAPHPTFAQINNQTVDPALLTLFEQDPQQYLPVSLLFADRVDVNQMVAQFDQRGTPMKQRVTPLLTALQAKANATQGPLLNFLQNHPGVDPNSIQPLWITNAIEARIQYQALVDLSNRTELEIIEYIPKPEVAKYESTAAVAAPGARENGLTAINAPGMWNLGYTGYNRKILIIDTGVDGAHPALSRNYLGNLTADNQAWYDPGEGTNFPNDCDSHGTHTAGSTVGMDPNTQDTIGVAFNALWMGAPAIGGFDPSCNGFSPSATFQWALNPDGDVNTTEDMPDVINNSWRIPYINMTSSYCTGTFSELMNTLEAANIAVVFSAGNEGSEGSSTMGMQPALNMNLVNVFSVGSINANVPSFPISGFSSLGPTTCPDPDSGSLLIKPEVVAPGTNVRSSVPGGGYAAFSGTSMAGPHAAGALLLLKEAFPSVSAYDLKLALYLSAIDLGPAGEDNTFGRGLIDVKAAHDSLIAWGNTPQAIDRSNDVGLLGILNVGPEECDGFVLPLLNMEVRGDSTIGNLEVEYVYSDGFRDTVVWTGNTAPGGVIGLPLPIRQGLSTGEYSLEVNILLVNGKADYHFLDNHASVDFQVRSESLAIDPVPVICPGSNYLLEATPSSGEVVWYDQATDGEPVAFGNSFQTPNLNASKSYYAIIENRINGGKPTFTGDPGFVEATAGRALIFNALKPFTLSSVKVLCQGDGIRTFNLKDASGSVIQTKEVFIGLGPRTVSLDFVVPAGDGHSLEVTGIGNLYVSEDSIQYPYLSPGVLEIIGSDQGIGFYPYAYDWVISEPGMCERMEVPITIGNGSLTADFSPSQTNLSLPWGGTVTFTDNTVGATSWLWDFGDGNTSTQQNPVHSYTLVDTYLVKLTVTNADGCSDMQTTTIRATGFNVSLNDLNYQRGITVYPNPGTGIFFVELKDQASTQFQARIVDLNGKAIRSWQEPYRAQSKLELDLHELTDGVYFLHLSDGENQYSEKVILNR